MKLSDIEQAVNRLISLHVADETLHLRDVAELTFDHSGVMTVFWKWADTLLFDVRTSNERTALAAAVWALLGYERKELKSLRVFPGGYEVSTLSNVIEDNARCVNVNYGETEMDL